MLHRRTPGLPNSPHTGTPGAPNPGPPSAEHVPRGTPHRVGRTAPCRGAARLSARLQDLRRARWPATCKRAAASHPATSGARGEGGAMTGRVPPAGIFLLRQPTSRVLCVGVSNLGRVTVLFDTARRSVQPASVREAVNQGKLTIYAKGSSETVGRRYLPVGRHGEVGVGVFELAVEPPCRASGVSPDCLVHLGAIADELGSGPATPRALPPSAPASQRKSY